MEFYRGTGTKPAQEQVIQSPILTDDVFSAQTSPDKYRLIDEGSTDSSAGQRVVRAVNTALSLRMPLLVSGEPGSGKTQLGYAIAHELGKPTPLKFITKSVSAAQDLFYTYDAVRHFQVAQALAKDGDTSNDVREYIDYAPLGLAILLALPLKQREVFLAPSLLDPKADAGLAPERLEIRKLLRQKKPQQCVVIIDEIDKAPRDFPNNLLHEIENTSFRVPELGGLETPGITGGMQPIILITTNSERQLPDAFLRRCAYVNIEYPRGEALERILASRLEGVFAASAVFLKDIQAFYEDLRERQIIDKPPGTAELLQFLQAMAACGADPDKTLAEQLEITLQGTALLAKIKSDQERLEGALKDWAKKG